MVNRLITFCLESGVIIAVLVVALIGIGVAVMPFDTPFDDLPFRSPVPVDAIPDISENQVVVATEWPGRSPRDVEDQITYPLSTRLQGIPNVVDIRGISGFGFSRIYVIFEDDTDFYWARTRTLERLATASTDLPPNVVPSLGPDATALGQIFWYTVDGLSKSLDELRAVQDFEVKYALQTVPGVAEVASVGGQVREYQVNIRPERLLAYNISVPKVVAALKKANLDIGARTHDGDGGGIEFLVRGVGFVKKISDLEDTVVTTVDHVPVFVRDIADVAMGPGFRRGALVDDIGERVGGIVVMRFGANPKIVIDAIKAELTRLNGTLAARGMTITAFYDRTQLIGETLGTLSTALTEELIVTVFVVLLFLMHVRTSLVVAATLPLAVLMSFIAMRVFGVDSNLMSLGGIAIAIGVMVDMAIIMAENNYNYLLDDEGQGNPTRVVEGAAHEVGGAILTSVATVVVSFLPVFFLTGQEGKLFRPLAWTKTFCMMSAALLAIVFVPLLCRAVLVRRAKKAGKPGGMRDPFRWLFGHAFSLLGREMPPGLARNLGVKSVGLVTVSLLIGWAAADIVSPAAGLIAGGVAALALWRAAGEKLTPIDKNPISRSIHSVYRPTLRVILKHKLAFLAIPLVLALIGFGIWLGGRKLLLPLTAPLEAAGVDTDRLSVVQAIDELAPGIGKEFMPPLDEGSLLYMPSLLPTASLSETLDALLLQNQAIRTVPEVLQIMGKLGRAETALDPAPVGMIETVVNLKPRDQWRPGLTLDTLVAELRDKTRQAGITQSWLQPIETRVVMLQSGIKASIAMKAYGTDDAAVEKFCTEAEAILREVPGASDVSAQRTGGKPYLEFRLDRERLGHYGIPLLKAQNVIQIALGGMPLSLTVEGRERYALRARYARGFRNNINELGRLLLPTNTGTQVPISSVAEIVVRPGPAAIFTEHNFVYSYVSFNATGRDEVGVVEDAQRAIAAAIESGRLTVPQGMTTYAFGGRYENQVRAAQRLVVLVPAALLINLFLLYIHFRRLGTTLLVFAGIPLAFAGGFIFISLWPGIEQAIYWFDTSLLGGNYPMPTGDPVYLTVAVWVGFIALFGVSIEDGVIIATYIEQVIERRKPQTINELHSCVEEAGLRRIRPALMTATTTVLALSPVLWSTGRGSDVMKPMAMPLFGGMVIQLLTIFIVPCVYTLFAERRFHRHGPALATVVGAPNPPLTPGSAADPPTPGPGTDPPPTNPPAGGLS